MKRLKLFIVAAILFVLATSCFQPKSEDFSTFWKSYKSDLSFQKQRTAFPLPYSYLDFESDEETMITENIPEKDWIFQDFQSDVESRVEIEQNGDTYEVWRRGNENGIAIVFIFKQREGRWYLTEVNDYSY